MTHLGIPGITNSSLLTSGGSSVLYEATQSDFGRRVAVKVLRGSSGPERLRRFDRERQAAGRLSGHPGIVDIYASGTTEAGEPYLVMPLLSGGSLQDELNRGPFPLEQAIEDIRTIADAVDYAHRKGVVHRDLKPGNLLRSESGRPVITDFGIARVINSGVTSSTIAATTPLYAAPEILADSEASTSSDIYSLGATLYALLNGRPAFTTSSNDNIWAIMDRVRSDEPAAIAGVPAPIMEVIRQAMAKTPVNRPTSAALFSQYLGFAYDEARRTGAPVAFTANRPDSQAPLGAITTPTGVEHRPLSGYDTPDTHWDDEEEPAWAGAGRWLGAAAVAAVLLIIAIVGLSQLGSDGNNTAEVASGNDGPVDTSIPAPAPIQTEVLDTTAEPEPPPAPVAASTPTATAAPVSPIAPLNYLGPRFAGTLPDSWSVASEDRDVGYGYRSRFNGDGHFVIVDTTPSYADGTSQTIEQSARDVAATLRSASPVTAERMGNKDTWWFTYTGTDGVLRIDIFFEEAGDGYAVLAGSNNDSDEAFGIARSFVASLVDQ